MADGRFSDLLGWLREKVYRQGQRYRAAQLVEELTGRPPSYRPLVETLRAACAEIYDV